MTQEQHFDQGEMVDGRAATLGHRKITVRRHSRNRACHCIVGQSCRQGRVFSSCARSPVKLLVGVVSFSVQAVNTGPMKLENTQKSFLLLSGSIMSPARLSSSFARGHPGIFHLTWSQRFCWR